MLCYGYLLMSSYSSEWLPVISLWNGSMWLVTLPVYIPAMYCPQLCLQVHIFPAIYQDGFPWSTLHVTSLVLLNITRMYSKPRIRNRGGQANYTLVFSVLWFFFTRNSYCKHNFECLFLNTSECLFLNTSDIEKSYKRFNVE